MILAHVQGLYVGFTSSLTESDSYIPASQFIAHIRLSEWIHNGGWLTSETGVKDSPGNTSAEKVEGRSQGKRSTFSKPDTD